MFYLICSCDSLHTISCSSACLCWQCTVQSLGRSIYISDGLEYVSALFSQGHCIVYLFLFTCHLLCCLFCANNKIGKHLELVCHVVIMPSILLHNKTSGLRKTVKTRTFRLLCSDILQLVRRSLNVLDFSIKSENINSMVNCIDMHLSTRHVPV